MSNKTSIDILRKELQNCKPVSPKEELALWERVQQGDETALNKLIQSNLHLTYKIAKNYDFHNGYLDDLIVAAQEGLVEAARRYDITKNVRLETYASWWMKKYIIKFLNDELKCGYYKDADNERHKIQSLDACFTEDESGCLNDYVPSYDDSIENMLIAKEGNDSLHEALTYLTEDEFDIVSRYYGLDNRKEETCEEIGKSYDICKQAVSLRLKKIAQKIRAQLSNEIRIAA